MVGFRTEANNRGASNFPSYVPHGTSQLRRRIFCCLRSRVLLYGLVKVSRLEGALDCR